MLEYLENTFPAPDLIILDENLLRGFVADETASESDMRTLLKVLKGSEAAFIQNLIQISSQFASQIVAANLLFSQIVNGRRISKSDISEDTILDFYARQHNLTESQIEQALDYAGYVAHYNTVRLHSSIGFVTPLDKLEGRDKEILAARDRKLEAAREIRRLRRNGLDAAIPVVV